jgi:hypothetical protein
MATRWWTVLLLAGSGALSGCGTIANNHPDSLILGKQGPRRIYGGVRGDVECGFSCIAKAFQSDSVGGFLENALLLPCCCAIDLPLSAIGDTITLQVTIRATLDRATSAGQPPSPEQPTSSTPQDPPSLSNTGSSANLP